MQHAQTQNNTMLYVILICFVLVVLFQELNLGRFLPKSRGGQGAANFSSILAFLTLTSTLELIAKKKLDDMNYLFYLTQPLQNQQNYGNTMACIYELQLPFSTKTHVVGVSKKHGLDRITFNEFLLSNGMERIELEGDFPDHFDVYGPPGQQFNARLVLDPAAMESVVEFCDEHFWEISNDSFYAAFTSGDHDNVDIVKQSMQFAQLIKPVLLPSDPEATTAHHEASYGEYDGPALPCPICKSTMLLNDMYQQCPNNHGILLLAKNLIKARKKELVLPTMTNASVDHNELECPNCHNNMQMVAYEGSTKTVIASCMKCTFRWLDVDDIEIIKKMYNNFSR